MNAKQTEVVECEMFAFESKFGQRHSNHLREQTSESGSYTNIGRKDSEGGGGWDRYW